MWHLSRTQDRIVAVMHGKEEEWFRGSWYEKLGATPTPAVAILVAARRPKR